MSKGDWALVLSGLSLAWPVFIFIGRNWLAAWISKSIQHRFDKELEKVRAELRSAEEQFKSDLRDREAEITALRNSVLAGSAGRQALLDKRRFDAVEKVWTAVNDFAPFKSLAASLVVLDLKAVARRASDPRMQEVLTIMGSAAPDMRNFRNVARDERPFLPDLAWAFFTAYTTILYSSHALYTALQLGVEDGDELFDRDAVRTILKAALPHRSKQIDTLDPNSYYYLIDEIEGALLSELRKILEGQAFDKEAAERAKGIMEAIRIHDAKLATHGAPVTH